MLLLAGIYLLRSQLAWLHLSLPLCKLDAAEFRQYHISPLLSHTAAHLQAGRSLRSVVHTKPSSCQMPDAAAAGEIRGHKLPIGP